MREEEEEWENRGRKKRRSLIQGLNCMFEKRGEITGCRISKLLINTVLLLLAGC